MKGVYWDWYGKNNCKKRNRKTIEETKRGAGVYPGTDGRSAGCIRNSVQKDGKRSYNISVKTLRKLKGFTSISIDYLMFGEQKAYEDIWMQLQTVDHFTKMKLLFRLIVYFGTDSSDCFADRRQEEEFSGFLDEWVEKYFSE